MAVFEKGHTKLGGRKKGTPNKKQYKKVAEILAEHDINLTEMILDLMDELTSPSAKIQTLLDLLPYCEAKKKESEAEELPSSELDDAIAEADTETLLKIVRNQAEGK